MPLFWVSLAFLTGILLAASTSIPILFWVIPALIAFILFLPPVFRRIFTHLPSIFSRSAEKLIISTPILYPLMILFLSIGAMRYQLAQTKISPTFIAYYNDQPGELIIEGVLVEPPDGRDSYTNLRVSVRQIASDEGASFSTVNGLLLVRVPPGATFNYGDRLRLQGKLKTPSENEDFSYRDYLANRGIYSYMPYPTVNLLASHQGNWVYSSLYSFRAKALKTIYFLFTDPEASLQAGILLGVQSGIPQPVQEAFRLTGTSHIIVISGFNITIIAGMFTLLSSRLLGRYRGALVAAIGIIFYTLLVGANAAVVRAAILGLLALLGHLIGRRQVGLNSLVFAGAIMAFVTPTVLWDVSFQLSFAATLGIMLYAEPLTNWFIRTMSRFIPPGKAERLAGPVGEYFLLTLAAQLTTLPLMIYYFKRISLTSLIANPLILPAQPPLMMLGGVAILLGMIFRPLGQLFAWAAWPFTAYTIRVVEWLARLPHGSIPLGQVAFPLLLVFYILLFTVTFFRQFLSRLRTRLTPAIPITILAVITVMVWKAAFYAPDGRLHVTILDVGTGEAVLIQSPAGRSVLINGGPSTVRLSDALGRRLLPFNHTLDWLVIAGIDGEDLSGIHGNLERFTPANVLWSGNTNGTQASSELWSALETASIPITPMQPGQALDLGSGAWLKVISITPRGAVLLLEWDNFRLLLPLGLDFDTLDSLYHNAAMRNVTAVLLPESGYAPLNPPEVINFLHPQLALLSVAPADWTGLPTPETLAALQDYNLLRTDLNGWIQLTTDGKQMWVEVERNR